MLRATPKHVKCSNVRPPFSVTRGFVATSTASLSLSNWVFPASSLSGPVVVVVVLFLRATLPAVSVFVISFCWYKCAAHF